MIGIVKIADELPAGITTTSAVNANFQQFDNLSLVILLSGPR